MMIAGGRGGRAGAAAAAGTAGAAAAAGTAGAAAAGAAAAAGTAGAAAAGAAAAAGTAGAAAAAGTAGAAGITGAAAPAAAAPPAIAGGLRMAGLRRAMVCLLLGGLLLLIPQLDVRAVSFACFAGRLNVGSTSCTDADDDVCAVVFIVPDVSPIGRISLCGLVALFGGLFTGLEFGLFGLGFRGGGLSDSRLGTLFGCADSLLERRVSGFLGLERGCDSLADLLLKKLFSGSFGLCLSLLPCILGCGLFGLLERCDCRIGFRQLAIALTNKFSQPGDLIGSGFFLGLDFLFQHFQFGPCFR